MSTTNVLDQLDAADRAAARAEAAEKSKAAAKALAEYQQSLLSGRILQETPETIRRWTETIPITRDQIRQDLEDRRKHADLKAKLDALPSLESAADATATALGAARYAKEQLPLEVDREIARTANELTAAQRFEKQLAKERADLAQQIESLQSNGRAFPNE